MGPKRMMSASDASRRVIGPMNAETGHSDAPEAEATREDTRKLITTFTPLVVLALEIEDIEADLDPIEGIIAMRAALSAVSRDISRGTVLK